MQGCLCVPGAKGGGQGVEWGGGWNEVRKGLGKGRCSPHPTYLSLPFHLAPCAPTSINKVQYIIIIQYYNNSEVIYVISDNIHY